MQIAGAFLIHRRDIAMTLTNEEAHCLARLLQSALYGGHANNIFAGCSFCKNQCNRAERYDRLLRKLQNETGVDLSPAVYGSIQNGGFPYKKFLKNSNPKIRDYLRNFF